MLVIVQFIDCIVSLRFLEASLYLLLDANLIEKIYLQ